MHQRIKKLKYALQIVLVLCTPRCVDPSVDDDTILHIMQQAEQQNTGVLALQTADDSEFLNVYRDFVQSKYPKVFAVVASICLIIGVIGNLNLWYYFGQKTEQIYYTRDAVYFRYLSVLDLAVCMVLFPYAMMFEAKLVRYNIICKAMEFVRHILFYMSHICLFAYSVELPRKRGHTSTERHMSYIMAASICLGMSCSMPVMMLYGVGQRSQSDQVLREFFLGPPANSTSTQGSLRSVSSLFEPVYCHMSFNNDQNSNYYAEIEVLRLTYYCLNATLYTCCIVFYFSQVIRYMSQRPDLGRVSLYIQSSGKRNTVVRVSFHRHDNVNKRQQSSYKRGMSQVDVPVLLGSHKKSLADVHDGKDRKKSSVRSKRKSTIHRALYTIHEHEDGHHESDGTFSVTKEQAAKQHLPNRDYNQKINDVDRGNDPSVQIKTAEPPPSNKKERSSVDSLGSSENKGQPQTPNYKNRSMITKGETDIDKATKEYQAAEERRRRKRQSYFTPLAQTLDNKKEELNRILAEHRQHRPSVIARQKIRSTGIKPVVRTSSYKVPMMILIFLDLFIIAVSVILYVTTLSSTVLNLIHTKSVISFYVISFINRDLHRVVWRKICPRWVTTNLPHKNSESIDSEETKSTLSDVKSDSNVPLPES